MSEVKGLKKRPLYDKLELDPTRAPKHGLDVKMESSRMENDGWARMMLQEIGKTVTGGLVADGMQYVGSIAIHLVVTKTDLAKDKFDMCSITQNALEGNVSEQLMALGFNNAQIQLRKHFSPNLELGRREDKR